MKEKILNRVCPYCNKTEINISRLAYGLIMEDTEKYPINNKKIVIKCGYCNNNFTIQNSIPKP